MAQLRSVEWQRKKILPCALSLPWEHIQTHLWKRAPKCMSLLRLYFMYEVLHLQRLFSNISFFSSGRSYLPAPSPPSFYNESHIYILCRSLATIQVTQGFKAPVCWALPHSRQKEKNHRLLFLWKTLSLISLQDTRKDFQMLHNMLNRINRFHVAFRPQLLTN